MSASATARTNLACFDAADVDAIVRGVRRELERKVMPARRAARLREELVLRDEAGAYFAIGIGSLKPYQWEAKTKTWQPVKKLPAVLEGSASLAVYAVKEREAASIDAKPAEEPLAFLRGLVEGARRAYRRGELTLVDAEALLTSFYAQDNVGRVWAVGAFTGAYYVFEEKRWQRANAPKPSAFSRGAHPADGELTLNDALVRFLEESDGAPPEALSAAWQPPPVLPEPLPPAFAVSTLSDVAERPKVHETHSDATVDEPPSTADEPALGRRWLGFPRWVVGAGIAVVVLLVGAGVVAAQIRPWDKGAEKRWRRFIAPVVRVLP